MAENQEVLVVFSADIQGMVQNVQAAMASIASSTQIAANKVADAVKQINQAHSSSQGGAKNGSLPFRVEHNTLNLRDAAQQMGWRVDA